MRLRMLLLITAAATMLAVPSAASAAFAHVVTAGESLSSVAATDGLSVQQLAAANGLSADAQLVAGSTLAIPPQGATMSAATSSAPSTMASAGAGAGAGAGDVDNDGDDGVASTSATAPVASSSSGSYVVQPGDTLSAIAANDGTSVAAIAAANGVDPNAPLLTGTPLRLTGSGFGSGSGSSSAGSASSSAPEPQPVGAAAAGSAGGPPYPTPETVSASQVGSIANANGVPSSLAQAIGWQESGFNNDLVSSAGARGVMQILPGTWDWIQRTLTAGTPLAPASAADNVRGGVLLLHSLLSSTGGDPAMAAAGYYQGLPSVQQNGLFTDTQQYVNNVMALQARFGGG